MDDVPPGKWTMLDLTINLTLSKLPAPEVVGEDHSTFCGLAKQSSQRERRTLRILQ